MANKNKKYNGPISVVSFRLKTEPWQYNLLQRYFKHGEDYLELLERNFRAAYIKSGIDTQRRALVSELRKIPYKIKDENGKNEKVNPKWVEKNNELIALIETIKIGAIKIQGIAMNEGQLDKPLFTKFGITNTFSFYSKLSVGNGTTYKDLGFDSGVLLEMGSNYFSAWEKFLRGEIVNGNEVKMPKRKKNNILYSFSKGSKKSNSDKFTGTSIDMANSTITFKNVCGREITMGFDYNPRKEYEEYALCGGYDSILRFSIVRELVRGKYHYYINFSIKGKPFNKGRTLSEGVVGIDPSTSGVVHYAENGTMDPFFFTTEHHEDEFKRIFEEVNKISRYMDRSRRHNNPNNYNEDGTIKPGKKIWVKSKNYQKAKNKLTELYRRATALKKEVQNQWANDMLKEGNVFNVEKTNFAALSKRSTKTTYKKDGSQRSKKRYGKTIKNNAPSQALSILKIKVQSLGGEYNEIPAKIGATGHDHISGQYTKHPVDERFVTLADNTVVQRDIHSAFNLANVVMKNGTYEFDDERMKNKFGKFLQKQEQVFEGNENRKPSIIGTKKEYEKKKMKKTIAV